MHGPRSIGLAAFVAATALSFTAAAHGAVPSTIPESTGAVRTLSPGNSVDAALDSAPAGQRIQLRAGTYSGNIESGRDGTASNPITLESAPGARATIKGSLKLNGASWIRVRNLKFDGAGTNGWGTSIWNSHHIEYSGLEISGYPGIAQGVLLRDRANDIWIFGNHIHDLGGAWPEHEHAVYLQDGARAYVYNNLIRNMRAGYGIHFWGNYDDAQVLNNTIVNSQVDGVTFGGNSERGYPDRAVVANNVIVDNDRFGVASYQANGAGEIARNNVLWNNRASFGGTGGWANQANVTANPMLDSGWRPMAGSPVVDKATSEGLTRDYDGNTRPAGAAPDIGAFERGAATPTPTPTPDPEPTPTPTPTPDPGPVGDAATLRVINTSTGATVRALRDGDTVALSDLPTGYDVHADPLDVTASSVEFCLDGTCRTENAAAWTLDDVAVPPPLTFSEGAHELIVRAYTEDNRAGTRLGENTVRFTVTP